MIIGTRKLAAALGGAVVVGAVLIYVIWSQQKPETGIALAPDDGSLVAIGEDLYIQECAACHGPDLEGQENWQERLSNGRLPAPPQTKYGPAALIGNGYESDMPAYEGKLSDKEIVAVLSFIKSRWPVRIKDRHDQIDARHRASSK
jgi:mono/diheme cytochrome c family protein